MSETQGFAPACVEIWEQGFRDRGRLWGWSLEAHIVRRFGESRWGGAGGLLGEFAKPGVGGVGAGERKGRMEERGRAPKEVWKAQIREGLGARSWDAGGLGSQVLEG